MPTLLHVPMVQNATPHISGDGEGLVVFLAPVNDPWIQARLGTERVIDEPFSLPGCRVTEGERYTNARSGWVQGRRYLWTQDGTTVMGALNVTLAKDAGRRKPQAVISNIFVHPSCRRQGVASAMVQRALDDFSHLVVDSSMSLQGAALFGVLGPGVDPADATTSVTSTTTDPTMQGATVASPSEKRPRRRSLR